MPGMIKWKRMTIQEGWIGYLGEVRMWSVIPWPSEEHRWPWQLQTHLPNFLELEAVSAARSSNEAKDIAERSLAWLLTRTQLAPTTQEHLDAVIPYLRNRVAQHHHAQWLRETGWWDSHDAALPKSVPSSAEVVPVFKEAVKNSFGRGCISRSLAEDVEEIDSDAPASSARAKPFEFDVTEHQGRIQVDINLDGKKYSGNVDKDAFDQLAELCRRF